MTFLWLWYHLHSYNAVFYVFLCLKTYSPFFLSRGSMLNVSYLSLPSCKYAEILSIFLL